jgi:hypothetical protein
MGYIAGAVASSSAKVPADAIIIKPGDAIQQVWMQPQVQENGSC